MKLPLIYLMVLALFACAANQPVSSTQAGAKAAYSASSPMKMKMKKRARRMPSAIPVTYNGVRYEALIWGRERGLGQNGGYVVAIDAASGHEIELLKIYKITNERGVEGDKSDIFITNLDIDEERNSLIIDDEHGRRFYLDLNTKEVKQLESE
ncbi:MAG: hypothetical protein RPU63_05425 [Candidatus Sedimenticola sp. (ex Thyasira tokunagai)]